MPAKPFQTPVPANGQVDAALSPFDRFGGGGGRADVKATVIAASSGDVNMTLMLGSDVVQDAGPIFGEANVGGGPTDETPTVGGRGGPGEPIVVRLFNLTAAPITVRGIVRIQNA